MTSPDPHQLASHLEQFRTAMEHIDDASQRIATANEGVRVLLDAVGTFSAVRLDSVLEATRDGYGPRELGRVTGVSSERITQFRNRLRKQGRLPLDGGTA